MSKAIKSVLALVLAFGASAAAFADLTPMELVKKGRADEAIKTLNEKVSSAATAENYYLLCRAYYSIQDYDNAIRTGERAVQLDASVAAYHLWLGRAYGEKADQSGALSAFGLARKTVASFERALKLDPNDWHARRDLAEYYIEAPGIVGGGKDKARKLADEIAPKDAVTAAWIRASIAAQDKNYGEAEVQFKVGVNESGNSAAMLLELARFYRRQQRWQQFDATMKQALESKRTTPADLYDAGEMLIKANRDVPLGVETMRKYLESDEIDDYGPAFKAHYLIGQGLEKQNKKSEAQQEYRAALSLASGFRPAQDALRKLGS